MNAARRIRIGCTIAACAWLMAAASAYALTDLLSSVDPRLLPGPYPVGCSDVAQDFTSAPSDNDRGNYWEGTSIGGQGHYVTQLLLESQGALIYDVNVPNVSGLFTTFAGQHVAYAAIVCYPTSADNTRPDYPYDAAGTKFVPRMQRGSQQPLWADANARYPVLLYSHGLSGSPLSGDYLQTITLFASYGYVVVAPFHGDGRFADVSIDGLSGLVYFALNGGLRKVVELQAIRPLSLQSALDALLADPNYRDHVDAARVAGFGISLGAESLLLFSGAQLTTHLANLQSTQVMSDARLKAISGYVPYFGQQLLPAFGDNQIGVDGMTVPFLGIVGTADTTAPLLLTEQGVNRMQGARYVVAFDGLTHTLVLADLPDIYTWTLTFFDAYLQNSAAARAQIASMKEVKGGVVDSVHIAYTPPFPPANGEQIVYLEEPADGGTVSGVSNIRGWAVAMQPSQRVDLYIDGRPVFTVPYGGTRGDVGAAYPSYPGSANSGFSMTSNFGLLSAGPHTFMARAIDSVGNVTNATATVNVVRFPDSFIANAADVSVLGASATMIDANTFRLNNVMVQGVSYNLSLRWNTSTQGFALTTISPNPLLTTGSLQGTAQSPPLAAPGARASAPAGTMIVNLEEPANGGTAYGVSNIRGWAVSQQPIQRVDLYIDGSLAFTVPYGGTRGDVGAAYPGYPGSANSGFSMTNNFALLSAGTHTFTTRAVDSVGNVTDATATFNVVRFPNSFIANAADVSLLGASATMIDANTFRLNNVMVQGISYNLTLRWNTSTQGFSIVATN